MTVTDMILLVVALVLSAILRELRAIGDRVRRHFPLH